MVSHQDGLSSGGLGSGWPVIRLVSHQVVFYQVGRLSGRSNIRVAYQDQRETIDFVVLQSCSTIEGSF